MTLARSPIVAWFTLSRKPAPRCSGEIVLRTGRTFACTLNAGTVVHCESGQLWITQTGDSMDRILTPGESHRCVERGKVVATALKPAKLSIQNRNDGAPHHPH